MSSTNGTHHDVRAKIVAMHQTPWGSESGWRNTREFAQLEALQAARRSRAVLDALSLWADGRENSSLSNGDQYLARMHGDTAAAVALELSRSCTEWQLKEVSAAIGHLDTQSHLRFDHAGPQTVLAMLRTFLGRSRTAPPDLQPALRQLTERLRGSAESRSNRRALRELDHWAPGGGDFAEEAPGVRLLVSVPESQEAEYKRLQALWPPPARPHVEVSSWTSDVGGHDRAAWFAFELNVCDAVIVHLWKESADDRTQTAELCAAGRSTRPILALWHYAPPWEHSAHLARARERKWSLLAVEQFVDGLPDPPRR